jgi:hypothetical protein
MIILENNNRPITETLLATGTQALQAIHLAAVMAGVLHIEPKRGVLAGESFDAAMHYARRLSDDPEAQAYYREEALEAMRLGGAVVSLVAHQPVLDVFHVLREQLQGSPARIA